MARRRATGIDERRLEAEIVKMMMPRAHAALNAYRASRLRRDNEGYPFRRHPGQRSVRSLAASRITRIPRGIRITVDAPGAYFLEEGNDEKGAVISAPSGQKLIIPLKKRGKRTGRGLDPKAYVFTGGDGRLYLATRRVRSYEGRHLLQKHVRLAFGLGFTVSRR